MSNIFEKAVSIATGGRVGGDYGKGFSLNPLEHITSLRDSLETAAILALNYYLPGSGLLTQDLASKGSQEQLKSDIGKAAMLASGGAGAVSGNLGNYGKVAASLGDGGASANAASGVSGTTKAAGVFGSGLSATDLLTMYAIIGTGGTPEAPASLPNLEPANNTPVLPDLSQSSLAKLGAKRGRASTIKTSPDTMLGGAINRKTLLGV